MGQADPILTRLGAGPAVKKLVETALVLSNSQDPQQRNHAYSFMESAIKELENEDSLGADAGLGPKVDDGLDAPKLREEDERRHDKDERRERIHEEEDRDERRERKMHEEEDEDERRERKLHEEEDEDERRERIHEEEDRDEKRERKLHEEVLDNHNNGPREGGSEQSTHNTAPYPGEGVDTTNGEKPMQDMDDTVNQWSETNGTIVPGIPPVENYGGGMNGGVNAAPGLMPDIAREMGQGMPAPPPMDTNQMMRQMQYTVQQEMRKYHNKVVIPLNRIISNQREAISRQREISVNQKNAIKRLSIEIREAINSNGTMKLDLDTIRQNATAKFRETEPILNGFAEAHQQSQTFVGVQPLPNYMRNKVAIARSEIESMDKMLNSQKNPMYN